MTTTGSAGRASAIRGGAFTLGVEEEFILVDPHTDRPSCHSTEVIAAGHGLGIELQAEFFRCQIETATAVGTHIRDLHDQLCQSRAAAADAAARSGCQLLAVGTAHHHPAPDSISDSSRYRRMVEHFGIGAGLICGAHVHVGVTDREQAVQVSNHLRPWLPTLLALTANSPIAGGIDTGYASWRHIRAGRWPSAGPPPYFRSADEYDAATAAMLDAGIVLDPGMIYWDVRPSDRLPTIEIRISDVPATIAETVTLTTLAHALVITAADAIGRGEPAPVVGQEMLRWACWRAAHDGLAGHGLDLNTSTLVPAVRLIDQLLAHARPVLTELGEYDQVTTSVAAVLAYGNGAVRQRQVLARRGRLADVIADSARRTFEGCIPEPRGTESL
ncbi:glutamate--cysteine ligase (plasmid) [Rhodococcus opacus]|uniref:glutamate--cysteine ligase 2 n=1 Tax=Rhodococcus opacus TaxID=37919 RepID=UPI0034D1E34E